MPAGTDPLTVPGPTASNTEKPSGFSGRMRQYGLLASVVVYFIATKDMSIYRYVEPFWMFGLFGTTPMWIDLSGGLV